MIVHQLDLENIFISKTFLIYYIFLKFKIK